MPRGKDQDLSLDPAGVKRHFEWAGDLIIVNAHVNSMSPADWERMAEEAKEAVSPIAEYWSFAGPSILQTAVDQIDAQVSYEKMKDLFQSLRDTKIELHGRFDQAWPTPMTPPPTIQGHIDDHVMMMGRYDYGVRTTHRLTAKQEADLDHQYNGYRPDPTYDDLDQAINEAKDQMIEDRVSLRDLMRGGG